MKAVCLLLVLITCSFFACAQKSKPVAVIFDTDIGPDYDDVGAITMLHSFADSGKAKILATIASSKYNGVAAVLDVFNTYFNKPGIPVGVPKGKAIETGDFQHWSDTIRAKYAHTIKNNQEAEDAVELYRKILSHQPDHSVTIITVGFLTNISNLLKSNPDKYSSLTGKDLVRKKVNKLVSMAGRFPSGQEFNIDQDALASKYVFENWQRPVIFSGFEIGQKIKAGIPLISDNNIQNSPVKDVFRISIPMHPDDSLGRMSWDQTAVLVGVLGYKPWYDLMPGSIEIDKEGKNTWNTKKKTQYYLAEKEPSRNVEQLINHLMMHQPVKAGK